MSVCMSWVVVAALLPLRILRAIVVCSCVRLSSVWSPRLLSRVVELRRFSRASASKVQEEFALDLDSRCLQLSKGILARKGHRTATAIRTIFVRMRACEKSYDAVVIG